MAVYDQLSQTEKKALILKVQGLTNQKAAEMSGMGSRTTFERNLMRALGKMETSDPKIALRRAREDGQIPW